MLGSARIGFFFEPLIDVCNVHSPFGFGQRPRQRSHVKDLGPAEKLCACNGIKVAEDSILLGRGKRHVNLPPSEQNYDRMTLKGAKFKIDCVT